MIIVFRYIVNAMSMVYIHVPILLYKMKSIFELHFPQNCSLFWAENSSQIGLQVKKEKNYVCLICMLKSKQI